MCVCVCVCVCVWVSPTADWRKRAKGDLHDVGAGTDRPDGSAAVQTLPQRPVRRAGDRCESASASMATAAAAAKAAAVGAVVQRPATTKFTARQHGNTRHCRLSVVAPGRFPCVSILWTAGGLSIPAAAVAVAAVAAPNDSWGVHWSSVTSSAPAPESQVDPDGVGGRSHRSEPWSTRWHQGPNEPTRKTFIGRKFRHSRRSTRAMTLCQTNRFHLGIVCKFHIVRLFFFSAFSFTPGCAPTFVRRQRDRQRKKKKQRNGAMPIHAPARRSIAGASAPTWRGQRRTAPTIANISRGVAEAPAARCHYAPKRFLDESLQRTFVLLHHSQSCG